MPSLLLAQMERERVTGQPDEAVSETFWAPKLAGMSTVETLGEKNMNVTIMHNFGPLNQEPFRNFLGMDFGATVRLGIDYGITEQWSVGVARTSPQKLYDFGSKLRLFQQNRGGSIPISVAVKGNLGINTNENGFSFSERLNFLGSVMAARKFSDTFSLQLTPMYAHFNRVFEGQENGHFALGIGGEVHLSDRWALMAEYFPVFGDRSAGTKNAFSVGVNIETGGHVFQLFFKSSNWHTEQHVISQNTEDFWAGDIRFGFNVNRVFWLGAEQR
ncbi:MAG: DUF5777 family beta-barrel protein [Balneolaceae bacterium]|nr:DUF5777 family beta-barrel protein [Balneolaceae bacterium]